MGYRTPYDAFGTFPDEVAADEAPLDDAMFDLLETP